MSNPEGSTDIFDAVFGGRGDRGVIVENAVTYPDGSIDLDDALAAEFSAHYDKRADDPIRRGRGKSARGSDSPLKPFSSPFGLALL